MMQTKIISTYINRFIYKKRIFITVLHITMATAQTPQKHGSDGKKWQFPNLTPPWKPKQEYQRTPSILDQTNQDSQLNKSQFHGFYNLAVIFICTFLFTQPIVNWVQNGQFFDQTLYHTFKEDYVLCLMVWPLFFGWSFTSFLLQKMILAGINNWISLVFQHLTQAGLFIFSSYMILTRNWCSSHAAFVILQACAHFMKMHSYTTVNRDFRNQQIQSKKQGKQALSNYANNINIKDFILFMWTPWLVYDIYPRRSTISLVFIMKKSIITIVCILMSYIIHTEYLIPLFEAGDKYSQVQLILRGTMPSTMLLVLLFYIVFENITNVFAEITKLDHRQFYDDWWNSTTYEEFNRKWNRPVHMFLYRHVYLQLIVRYKTPKNQAQMITFLFSAMLHEYLLAIIFRTVRPFFLGFIIFQVPLIYLTKFMKGKKSGTYLFWFGIIIGPSIIISCYLKITGVIFTKDL